MNTTNSKVGMRCTHGYAVLASGAAAGALGCELWADLDTPYATVGERDLFFRPSDFVVLASDPRLLLVRVSAQRLHCTVAVVHAPHSGVPLLDREEWWRSLTDRLAGQPDLVILADANARLGSVASDAVGCGGFRQEEDANGELFHRTLLALGSCVPATFAAEDPCAFTWTSNAGSPHRIDYVAVPACWSCLECGTGRFDVARREVPSCPRRTAALGRGRGHGRGLGGPLPGHSGRAPRRSTGYQASFLEGAGGGLGGAPR